MDVIQHLNGLGFVKAEVEAVAKGVSTVRVRTAKGWVYHRFSTEAQIDAWARYHKPELEE
ncbi:hypothetical protein [Agrobacterium pusense]|uniref:hypothetical protein n=1 Tax=Agrobacterium pusense TaxID=648995 RepID=UPI000D19D386|nr:hypothetical protein [Agrobacterium pusense]